MSWLWVLACGSAEVGTDCAAADQPDVCRQDVLLAVPPTATAEVVAAAEAIADPVLRGAALFTWIDAHRGRVPVESAETVCAVLEGRVQHVCERRISAAHLNRD